MTTHPTEMTVPEGRQEVVVTRDFDAPRERVFAAHTDPEAIAQWWGPRRLTTEVDVMDVRPGGRWRFVQHGADGAVHAFHGVYHDVDPPARLVCTFEYEGTPGRVILKETCFEARGETTRLVDRSVYLTLADRDQMVAAGMQEGLVDSMARIDELLAGS